MQEEIIKFVGELAIYGGGSVAIAYGIFLFLGKKWIENRFSERLQSYKHAQNKELEETKYKINSLFSRITKIHEKEFEVLPKSWSLLHDTIALITRFTSVYKEYPDFDSMSEPQLDESLKDSFLYGYQKDELKTKQKKLEYYQECLFYHEMNLARNAMVEFHTYIQKNRIFLSPDLKDKFKEIDDVIWDAYVNMEVGYQAKESKMKREAWNTVRNKVAPIKNAIEEMVQDRLHYEEAK